MSADKKRRELGGLTQVINLTNYVIQIFRKNDFFSYFNNNNLTKFSCNSLNFLASI